MRAETAFAEVGLPQRQSKPRQSGLTMMIDWGLPVAQQRGTLETAGDYIDMAKIAGAVAGLLPKAVLQQKLAAYHAAEVSTSQGGLFTEYAFVHSKLPAFFAEVTSLGFSAVEISDNLIDWSLDQKREAIRMAIDDFGLNVLGEVGRKEGQMTDAEIVADLEACIDAGVSAVFIEAYELFAGERIRADLIAEIARRFADATIIYELPVIVLPGISRNFKHKVASWMVAEFGPDVNLANVEWDEILFTEMTRRRVGDNLEIAG